MTLSLTSRRALTIGLAALLAGGPALAQTGSGPAYKPESYQPGKDVVWVPTPQALVDRMLDTAKATPADTVIDLGSGDGRTVITAAKRGIKALGIEYNPDMVELAKRNAEKEGVSDKATFIKADLFETDFSQATVLTLFLLSSINLKLRPKILDMKPGTRVVSNTFDMGDWKPDQSIEAGGTCESYCRAYYWVVPAKVEGAWTSPRGDLTLDQTYQIVSGTLDANGTKTSVTGRLEGETIMLKVGSEEVRGKVTGSTIDGEGFRATRKGN
jgi:hypothetical protein